MDENKNRVKISDFYTINDKLPIEILLHIFSYVEPKSIFFVCKYWNKLLINNDRLWKNWFYQKTLNDKYDQYNLIKGDKWLHKYINLILLKQKWLNNKYTNYIFNDFTGIMCCKLIGKNFISVSEWGMIKSWNLMDIIQPIKPSIPNIYTGHLGPLKSIDVNDKYIVSGADDGIIKLWKLNQRNYFKMLTYHEKDVYCVKLINNKIISGGKDKKLAIYNLDSEKLEIYSYHNQSIWDIVYDETNKNIYTSSIDGSIGIWIKNDDKYTFSSRRIINYPVLNLLIYQNFLIVSTWNGRIEIRDKFTLKEVFL